MAEQDAAKHALIGIREKVKNEGQSLILEDTVFCKSIVNEYTLKMNMNPPTYATNRTEAFIPMFVSSLELNGATYVGQAGKNKKEAEQFAARSAIVSILGSEFSTTMSEIVKSKFKLYDALKKVNDSPSAKPEEDFKDSYTVQGGNVPGAMNPSEDSGALLSDHKKNEVITVTGPPAEIPESSSLVPVDPFPSIIQNMLPESTVEQPSKTQATHKSLHVFKKPKLLQASPSAIAPPAPSAPIVPCIEFVPPASEQAPTPRKKQNQNRKRRNAKKKGQQQPPLAVAMIPQNSAPA